jgi:pyruvate kinase
VHIVGNVLVKGERVNQFDACGTVCVCKSSEEARMTFREGDILVISQTDNSLLDLLKRAKGIITEVGGLSSHAAIVGLSLDIPVVCGAAGATDLLKSGTTVTIDSSRGLVFAGEQRDIT